MEQPHNPEETLFDAARVLKDPAQRAAFLTAACQHDPALRQRVERLLADATAAADYFDQIAPQAADLGLAAPGDDPTLETTADLSRRSFAEAKAEGPGTQIGKYKLLQVIGEGGMGVVYLAEEQGELRRKVAFKIIKLGMDTRSVVARFEAERQALALMDHRNIAKVFDAGATDTGRPYFVMELVKGIPITEYCDKNKLTVEQRLALFVPVCEAIQHAHHKGIIHRDIKPSNVLVAHFDGKPVPLVIDFGIAKATHQRLTEKTQWTEFGQFIGTPAYVSPEQAEGSQLDIDTRSDVYSLGVLLYELLTGSQPFPDKRLRGAGWREMQRILLEDEPDRPSTRLSTLTEEERTRLTKTHPEDVGRISLILRRELDWIVMKCLEKDRVRRYDTATALAADVGNYLKGEAIVAVPPSRWYRFSKLARKHKKTFAAAAALAVILTGATVFSTWQAIVANRERAIATAVSDFLDKDLLQAADVYGSDPFQTPHRDLRLLEVVNRASANLQGKFTDQPVVEASIRLTLGKIFAGLGELLVAEEHLERALELFERTLGDKDLRTAEAAHYLGGLLSTRYETKRAETALNKAFSIRRQLLGAGHPDVLDTRLGLVWTLEGSSKPDEVLELLREILDQAARSLPADHAVRIHAMEALAGTLLGIERSDEALPLFQQAHELLVAKHGTNDLRVSNNELAQAFMIGWTDYPKALQMWEKVLNRNEEMIGASSVTGDAYVRVGGGYSNRGLTTRGRAYSRQAYDLSLNQAGPNHPWTYQSKMTLGWSERDYLPPADVVRHFEEVFADYRRVGSGAMNQQQVLNDLQMACWRAGEYEKLLKAARDSVAIQHEKGWPSERQFPTSRLAWWLARLGHWEEAAEQRALLLTLPMTDPNHRKAEQVNAAVTFAMANRTDEARGVIRERMRDFALPQLTELDTALAAALVLDELPASLLSQLADQPAGAPPTAPELLMQGLAWFRRGNFERAAEMLQPFHDHAPDPALAILAGGYLSLAHKELEQAERAQLILADTNTRIERLLRAGDPTSHKQWGPQWLWVALGLLARDEVERSLPGAVRSVPINAAYLERMRGQWKPVQTLLDTATQAARHQRWPEARTAFLAATQHPAFSWEAADFSMSDLDEHGPVGNLRFLMALAFKRAGDEASYADLCEPPPPEAFLAPLNRMTVSLDLRQSADRVLVYDFGRMFHSEPSMGGPEWRAMLGAFADYAADRDLERVAAVSAAAAEKCHHWGRQTVGLALGAATHAKLDNHDQARELLGQAEARWRELDENNRPDRAWHWPELALCELALEEARRQIGKGTVAASQ